MTFTPSTLQELTLDAPVATVTLLEDRAQVRREAHVHLTAGLWRLRVNQVAPVLSDKSLRAEFITETSAHIDDVRVRRQMLVKESDRPEELQTLLQEWRSLHNQFNHLSEDRGHLEYTFQQIDGILTKTVQELPIDAVWGQLDPKSWRDQLQTLFQQLRTYRSEVLTTYSEQIQLEDRLNRLVHRIEAIQRPDLLYTAALEADLRVAETGEYAIAFDYVVPNALWRPWHQARLLIGNTPTLSFRTDACVWQRTGEDWNNVQLIFSTARASLGTEPPLLHDDLLSVQDKTRQVVVQARDQVIQTPGMGAASTSDTVELPGVDDGGETRSLPATTRATVPSDGRPYRVPLFNFEAPAQVQYVLMPELTPQVILKSEHSNRSNFPILAGPVDLVRSSEFVGRTSTSFIASGEQFALGWGPDAALRVQRTQTQEKEQNHLTRWITLTRKVTLFLSNISDESRMLKITERIPVSELEQVKVEAIASDTTHGVQPDENGFCTWQLTLEPYSQQKVKLVYKLSAAPEVQGL